MKLLAYILAIMVLTLSVRPGMERTSLSTSAKKPCCAISMQTSTSDKSNKTEDTQDTKNCNPFQACCSCILIVKGAPYSSKLQTEVVTKQSYGLPSLITTMFISDFWQPPQVIV